MAIVRSPRLRYDASMSARVRDQAVLKRIEHHLDEVFALGLPGCRDTHFVGGLLRSPVPEAPIRTSVSGAGFTPAAARMSCLGEAAEYLSFHRQRDDPLVIGAPAEEAKASDPLEGVVICRSAVSGIPIRVPAHLVLRDPRQIDVKTRTTSNGLGAGMSLGRAKLHGLLELIERHEVMSWWLLQEPRPGVRDAVVREALPEADLPARSCEGPPGPWFLLLSATTGVPVIGAFHQDEQSGRVAFGFKAAPTLREAARGAFLELRQHELALYMAAARGTSRAASELRIPDFPCLLPVGISTATGSPAAARSFQGLSRHLQRVGIGVLWADLTRPGLGIPVARVLSYELQGSSRESIIEQLGARIQESARPGSRTDSLPNLY